MLLPTSQKKYEKALVSLSDEELFNKIDKAVVEFGPVIKKQSELSINMFMLGAEYIIRKLKSHTDVPIKSLTLIATLKCGGSFEEVMSDFALKVNSGEFDPSTINTIIFVKNRMEYQLYAKT